jgi:nucleotide-binding universal stress UspA family protein
MATKPVIVGVDGSEESLLAVEWAALEARRHSSPLRIVSVPDVMPRMHAYHASPAEIAADPERISADAARHLAAALEDWHDKYPDVPVRQDVIRGHPGRVLASYSARADLVVLGRHGHPAGPGPGIGSIQHAVLDNAHGPVAVVPSGD